MFGKRRLGLKKEGKLFNTFTSIIRNRHVIKEKHLFFQVLKKWVFIFQIYYLKKNTEKVEEEFVTRTKHYCNTQFTETFAF